MRFKTWLAIVLSILLLMSGTMALAEEVVKPNGGAGSDVAVEPAERELIDHLTVANTTQITDNFFSNLWGNGTSDIDVRYLLHGYNLVQWNGGQAQFAADPSVVRGFAVTENEAGDRSYVFVLADDLFFSDGTKITAWDYAFSILLQMSPQISELGGVPDNRTYLLGYDEYIAKTASVEEGQTPEWHCEGGVRVFPDGAKPHLSGVRVLADDTLMITLNHEYLPYFYEVGLLSCAPYPITAIAPGVVVKDDGDGVYLANADSTVDEPVFTTDLLRQTILDQKTGYLLFPSVGCGPYLLASFDGTTAEFDINPLYKGDSEGRKPTIAHLTFTLADNETMVKKLADGEYDVINKVTKASAITEGVKLVHNGGYLMTNYPRTGLSQITFVWERPAITSLAVREAIAWCMNRDKIAKDYTGGFGMKVDGYYGIGQWMVSLLDGTIALPVQEPADKNDAKAMDEYKAELAAWKALSLDDLKVYSLNIEKAQALLDADGWKLNEDGLREKDGVVLDLTLAYPEGNAIAEIFEANLTPNLEKVGIRLTLKPVPMPELLRYYYRQPVNGSTERDMDMIYIATNFELVFDPAVHFGMNDQGDDTSWSFADDGDKELYNLAVAMRQTEPGHLLEYVQRWLAFEKRVTETLPIIPIYSNVYFDFYTERLHGYDVSEQLTWSRAILGASLDAK